MLAKTTPILVATCLAFTLGATLSHANNWGRAGPNGENWTPAKQLFGYEFLPSTQTPASHGTYTRGCLAGGIAIAADGPTWQTMRLSRNRRWGHPNMVKLVERLSREAAQFDGWPGLLVGDISQPRGGPMLSGHASHQMGIDADIWLRPMPAQRFSYNQRENESAISVLKAGTYQVDNRIWTQAHGKVLKRAASYDEVQRIFIHPGIKKKMCETYSGQAWMSKLRPWFGHHYHFHIRLHCQPGSVGCKKQNAVPAGDGCGDLDYWFNVKLPGRDKPKPPPDPKPTPKPDPKPKRPNYRILSDLPAACQAVLTGPRASSAQNVTLQAGDWQENTSWQFSRFRAKSPPLTLPKTTNLLPNFRRD